MAPEVGQARPPTRAAAVALALFVTVLWSSSWVLIKLGLEALPALTFAGLRYTLASACLAPFALGALRRLPPGGLGRRAWVELVALGVLFYALTQGAIFFGLESLPTMTVSLLLNGTALTVAALSAVTLGERPGLLQWGGVLLFLAGAAAYLTPVSVGPGQGLALAVVIVGVLANAASALLGRAVNRRAALPPLVVTAFSMAVGGALLLLAGGLGQGLPRLGVREVVIVAWLAVVNTALAFTLWNRSLQTLTAVESSVLNGTMLIQIAVLAWVVLGERLDGRQIAGLAVAAAGALLVQLRSPPVATAPEAAAQGKTR